MGFFSSCFAKDATGEMTALAVLISYPCFISCNGTYASFFFCRELILLNKNKSCTKVFLKKAKISHPWKHNKRGMWITQHFLWLVYLSHTIMIKWLTCLYPLQKGFFAFSRGSAVQPTTQFYYFVLAILVLRYSNPSPFPPVSKFSRLKFKVNSNVII